MIDTVMTLHRRFCNPSNSLFHRNRSNAYSQVREELRALHRVIQLMVLQLECKTLSVEGHVPHAFQPRTVHALREQRGS